MGKLKDAFKKAADKVSNAISNLDPTTAASHANDKRKENQAKKKAAKREFKLAKKQQKQDGRSDRTQTRQDGRSERTGDRQETKRTAYENGIDPNAAWAGMGSNIANAAGSALSSIYGGGMSPNMTPEQLAAANSKPMDKNLIMIIGGLILALLIFTGLKRKGKK